MKEEQVLSGNLVMFCVGFIVVFEARKPHGYTYAQLTQEYEKPAASVSKYMEVEKGHMNITINIQHLETDNNSQCNFIF
jgi:hypothetical protein